MLSIVVIGLVLIGGCVGSAFFGHPDRASAPWFQLGSYHHGRIAHLTPMRDGTHVEDESGACGCNPTAGPFALDNGRTGTLFVHRVMADNTDRSAR